MGQKTSLAIFKPRVNHHTFVFSRKPPTPEQEKAGRPGDPEDTFVVQWEAPDFIDIVAMQGAGVATDQPLPLLQVMSTVEDEEEAVLAKSNNKRTRRRSRRKDNADSEKQGRAGVAYLSVTNEIIAAALVHPKVVPNEADADYVNTIPMKGLRNIPWGERDKFRDIIMEEAVGAMSFRERSNEGVDSVPAGEAVVEATE